MNDLCRLDLTELSARLASGQTSSSEIVEAFLEQIAAENANLNAFITVTADSARVAAATADRAFAEGRRKGPLHGLPIGHKDLYATKGVLTTAGSRVHETNVPERSATVVEKLEDAGMVSLGKLNTHEFAYGPTGEVSSAGASRNPWNRACISGGSSGGSAAAVAGALLPAATGSDTGGSIRMPAACCGLTGLKPTYGRVSRAGIFPLCWTMDHAGPITRSARDAALILAASAGHDVRDAASADRPVPDYLSALTGRIDGLRIGVPRRYFFDLAQRQVTDLVEDALAELEKLGAQLVDVDIPDIAYSAAAAVTIYLCEATAYHEPTITASPELYSEEVRTFLELGDQILAKDYLNAQRVRTLLGHQMASVLCDVDVIATPGIAITATPIGSTNVDIRGAEESVFSAILRNTEPFDLTGLPAVVFPCGFAPDGMPVSLQIAGRAFEEAMVLNVAHTYQQASDWHRRRPPA